MSTFHLQFAYCLKSTSAMKSSMVNKMPVSSLLWSLVPNLWNGPDFSNPLYFEWATMSTNWLSDASSDRGMISYFKKPHCRYSLFQGGNVARAKIPPKQAMAYMPLKDSSYSRSGCFSVNSLTAYDEKVLEDQESRNRPRFAAMLPWLAHVFLFLISLTVFYASAHNYSRAGERCVKLQSAFCM